MPGLEIFKYDFSSQKHDFNLILYIGRDCERFYNKSKNYIFGKLKTKQEKKELKIISKTSSDTSETYWLNIIHPGGPRS